MDSSSSYHTCASVDVSKLSPPLDPSLCNTKIVTKVHVEYAENNNIATDAKSNCNVSSNICVLLYNKFNKFSNFKRVAYMIVVLRVMIKKTSVIKIWLEWKMPTILRLNFL